MNNKTDPAQQRRVILAVVLSFLFFIVYTEFFVEKKPPREQNASVNSALNSGANSANLGGNSALNSVGGVNLGVNLNDGSANSAANLAQSANLGENSNPAPLSNATTQAPQNAYAGRVLASIESEYFSAKIDDLGRISSFVLKDEKFKNEQGKELELIENLQGLIATQGENQGRKQGEPPLPLELRFSNAYVNAKAFATAYSIDTNATNFNVSANAPARFVLTQNLGDLVVQKKLVFYEKGNYDIEVNLSRDEHYYISAGARPSVAVDGYTVHGALLVDTEDTIQTFEDGDVDKVEQINAFMLSSFDRYYAAVFYNYQTPLNAFIMQKAVQKLDGKSEEMVIAYATSNNAFKAGGYIGAKEFDTLSAIDTRLERVIEYGWFTFIAKPMFAFLSWIFGFIGNWGWAIVVLTLIVRLVLFPLTYKSMMSMNKLKELAPKMTELREKYKGDPQKLNLQMMELYKKHGANPFAGCLPILLQIPIFFAIYRVLQNAVELKAAPWALWISDLSAMDPYYVLPILMGASMFVQQLITPMTVQDAMQAKIMKFLPIIFTFFFLWFPAGLTLYWCVNNICSLVQQLVINKMFAREHNKGQNNENRS